MKRKKVFVIETINKKFEMSRQSKNSRWAKANKNAWDGNKNLSLSKMSKTKIPKRTKNKMRNRRTFTSSSSNLKNTSKHTKNNVIGSRRAQRRRVPQKRNYQQQRSRLSKNKNLMFNSSSNTSSAENPLKRYYRTRTKTGKLPTSVNSFTKATSVSKNLAKQRYYQSRSQIPKNHFLFGNRDIFYRSLSSPAERSMVSKRRVAFAPYDENSDRSGVESVTNLIENEHENFLSIYQLCQEEEIDEQKKQNTLLIDTVESLFDKVLDALEKLALN